MKILIIGGVAAGMSAASKLKRIQPTLQIKVYEQGPDVSYGACGLPYFISGLNQNADLMRIRSVEQFRASGIEVEMGVEVVGLDPKARKISARNHRTGQEISDDYDKLIIASGANPVVPPLPGINLPGIFTLKTIPDAEKIRKNLLSDNVKEVAIIGAGYIGMEMVETCITLGKKVRVIEMKEQVLPSMDPDMALHGQHEAQQHGVLFNLGEAVTGFSGNGRVRQVATNKDVYAADLVVLSIGVAPNTKFLEGTGLEMLPNGAIITDKKMQTNIPDIYAAGDCCTVWHKLLNKPAYLPLGTNANKQGRALADVILGQGQGFAGALGTAVLRVLNLEMGRTGFNEKEAKHYNLEYGVSTVKAMNHAPYFPNPSPIHIKLTYHPKTKVIMGAQLAGSKGVASRVATMTAIIDQGMTTHQMNELDLPYAPPFSQVWDPLHIASSAAK